MARDEAQFQAVIDALKARPIVDTRQAFVKNGKRFAQLSLKLDDLLLDFSKCAIDKRTVKLLEVLSVAAGVSEKRDAMFAGAAINTTEERAVLHTALRLPEKASLLLDGHDIVPDIQAVLQHMESFAEGVRTGSITGAEGKAFTDIVNIGIGGSDLGPAMVTAALKPYHDGPRCHFVSNIDSAHIADTLGALNPATTLLIIASKTFTTSETMTNAHVARQWIAAALGEQAVKQHFAAVSTALSKIADFGIDAARVFGFWNWVGGRYSVWSAIGLPVLLAVGRKHWRQFLAGAHRMDEHFRSAAISANLPVMLGLVSFWHRVVCGYPSRAIIPYEQRLARLPAYLQQLDMESSGKSVTVDGKPAAMPTGAVVWGEPGTNGQHAFFQLLHQGTDSIPVEFIASVNSHEPHLQHLHDMLLANCLAQAEALLQGRGFEAVCDMLAGQGMPRAAIRKLAPHRVFSGNRPSVLLLQDILSPFALGRLLALYEHRTFVEGVLMNINSFDQWGVELGKELAGALLPELESKGKSGRHDASTLGLIAHIQAQRKKQGWRHS
ncbi:MAG: Glucose-6-phosphate isomerase [Candidatus Tokpelaia hoelldobleri]|uniref:Glucose-6-phosphate isomerase n=1 Tax=Candidatus Tokpelaia hoelldobleri TaxID=1902579 RepID=A0A1U9JWA3_9HYPH|nr:MAG: Glucose-6-phosphate isomerase [Candidatus Tokpelaia hoelldoblerii]